MSYKTPQKNLEQQLAARWPPADWQALGVVVAVSGGADSVALLRAMAALKTRGPGRLTVAHFNHHWRGDESDADCAFVCQLSRQLGLECVTGDADRARDAATPDGLEGAARHERYDFLRQTAESLGARYVVTAHTADDQAETVLHHVLRGTGLAGLAGMTRTRCLSPAVTLIRPLLSATRQDVLDYLAEIGQEYREDATNQQLRFTRNRIRHELLPQLERDYGPGVAESLVRLSELAGDAQRVIASAADRLAEQALTDGSLSNHHDSCVTIDCRALADQDRHLVREMLLAVWRRRGWPLQDMGFAEWDLLADMALAAVNLGAAAGRVPSGCSSVDSKGATAGLPSSAIGMGATAGLPSSADAASPSCSREREHGTLDSSSRAGTCADVPSKREFPGAVMAEVQGHTLVLVAQRGASDRASQPS